MNNSQKHFDLKASATQTMLEHGFAPDFSSQVQDQLAQLTKDPPRMAQAADIRDLRNLLWSSIDNDTSRDLDQIEVAEQLTNGRTKIMIGIADVDAFVPKGSAIDDHAAKQTTSVYTGVQIFPMLPEQLSTGTTSLLPDVDRLCVVIEFVVDGEGQVNESNLYRAIVRNKAQLTYNAVGAWLEGSGPAPDKVAASSDLQAQLKLQDQAAQRLKKERYRHGALNIESAEVNPIFANGQIVDLVKQQKNRATDLIEDFMIAANGIVARTLQEKHVSSIRRIVKTPKRWDRIVELAAEQGGHLPSDPESKALSDFMTERKAADPDHFADLSLAIIKLMGPGEYVLERPGDPEQGHFGLAVQDYTHSTAPNRRFPDLVTQRLIKSVLAKQLAPYSDSELNTIASNCTLKEDAARKVEREMAKRIAAIALSKRVGEEFDAIVTGATPKGTFVRLLQPHAEGLLAEGQQGVDVGDKLRVKLINTNVARGFIDFARV
ncbi:MAG TPA: RNB domain-containing ribonuclease [Terriglobales bacterium]|nr:RNB domain-containing ribonuclease [Terriglobales bacterium]